MKKTSLMQSLQSRFSLKAWRNGVMLLLLVCVMGVSEASAQSIVPVDGTSEYVSTEVAVKLVSAEINEFATIKVTNAADYAERKFYSDVRNNLQNGLSVEEAIEASRIKVTQKAIQLGGFTVSDVNGFYDEVDEKLKL